MTVAVGVVLLFFERDLSAISANIGLLFPCLLFYRRYRIHGIAHSTISVIGLFTLVIAMSLDARGVGVRFVDLLFYPWVSLACLSGLSIVVASVRYGYSVWKFGGRPPDMRCSDNEAGGEGEDPDSKSPPGGSDRRGLSVGWDRRVSVLASFVAILWHGILFFGVVIGSGPYGGIFR